MATASPAIVERWNEAPELPAVPGRWARFERWSKGASSSGPARLGRAAVRFAMRVGVVVSTVLSVMAFAVLALFVVVAPWAFQRILFLDPLGSVRGRKPTRWLLRRRLEPLPGRPWTRDPAVRPPRPLRRWRTAFGVIVLLVGTLVAAQTLIAPAVYDARTPPAAYADAPWWPRYKNEMDYLAVPARVWNPYDFQRVGDIDMRYIDVVDGRRATWQPPACGECPTVRVWVFGGSTVFGLGQRNEHTIASELAKIGYAKGYRLIVENFGVPGDSHWEEAVRFNWAATGGEPPDLVVFYDGVNDLAGARLRNGYHNNDDDQPVALSLEELRQGYDDTFWYHPTIQRLFRSTPRPEGTEIPEDPPTPSLDSVELAQRAATDYERARVLSAGAAASAGVDAVWFWQPVRVSRPSVPGEPGDLDNDVWLREHYESALPVLSDEVIDITDAFDGSDEPLFYDDVHHNELGAKLVAAAMWEHLEPRIEESAG